MHQFTVSLITGQYTDSKWGVQLQRLIDEFCCLHAIKARLDLVDQPMLISCADIPQGPKPPLTAGPDWLDVAVIADSLHHTASHALLLTGNCDSWVVRGF